MRGKKKKPKPKKPGYRKLEERVAVLEARVAALEAAGVRIPGISIPRWEVDLTPWCVQQDVPWERWTTT